MSHASSSAWRAATGTKRGSSTKSSFEARETKRALLCCGPQGAWKQKEADALPTKQKEVPKQYEKKSMEGKRMNMTEAALFGEGGRTYAGVPLPRESPEDPQQYRLVVDPSLWGAVRGAELISQQAYEEQEMRDRAGGVLSGVIRWTEEEWQDVSEGRHPAKWLKACVQFR